MSSGSTSPAVRVICCMTVVVEARAAGVTVREIER